MNVNIEVIESKLKQKKNSLEKAEELRLGFLLNHARCASIKSPMSASDPYITESFEFVVYSHGTGVSVRVNILNGSDRLEILNGTYWYSESTYGFNKFTRLNGAWDRSFAATIDEIRTNYKTWLSKQIDDLESLLKEKKESSKGKIAVFESLYN